MLIVEGDRGMFLRIGDRNSEDCAEWTVGGK